ncbi:hypothetical protein ACLOAV_006974 [Pseudogymnoascus australis]
MEQNTIKRGGVGLRGVDKEQSFGGYTLYAPLAGDVAYLVDIDGKEVHRWQLPGRTGRHARILANGNLAINTINPDTPDIFPFIHKYGGGVMSELDPAGNVVRQVKDPLGHHDQFHYGDGSYLYTSLEALSKEDSAKEVDPQGKVTFEWKVSERLPREEFPLQTHYGREHYPLINSVIPLKDGNILCSMRSISAVLIIERATGNIIWSLKSNVIAQQHCATELEDGNILIFDNGAYREGESNTYSRVIEVDRKTKEIVWQYRDPSQWNAFFTPFMGSAQRLANGNTLICESAFGRIFEVTLKGVLVWEYIVPHFAEYKDDITRGIFPGESNALFRAYRYSEEEVPWLNAAK